MELTLKAQLPTNRSGRTGAPDVPSFVVQPVRESFAAYVAHDGETETVA